MARFKNLEEAQQAVNEVLYNLKALFYRYDTYSNDRTEVICISENGVYWIVDFFEDGDIGFGIMNYELDFI